MFDEYLTEDNELCSGIFWVFTDSKKIEGFKMLVFKIPCDTAGKPLGGHNIPLNAKSGLTYNHKILWEAEVKNNPSYRPYNKKEYFYYPRGRVEISKNRATIFLNPHINDSIIISEIKMKFGLIESNIPETRIVADGSKHYECFIDLEV